jgi:uncharacterized membrane protein (UPF0182 family)
MKRKEKIRRFTLGEIELYATFVVGVVALGFLINLATSFIYEGLKEDSPFKQFITSQTKLFIGALIFLLAAVIAFWIFNKLRKFYN